MRKKRQLSRRWKLKLVLLLLLVGLVLLLMRMVPMLQAAALQQASVLASGEIVSAAREQIALYSDDFAYESLMHIERDAGGHITLLAPNTMLLNAAIADITLAVHEKVLSMENRRITFPIGTVSGLWFLANFGPDFSFRFRYMGMPNVSLKSEFNEAGINQVQHRIYLVVECDISVVVPFFSQSEAISCTVLLTEGIIVGYTPDTYVGIGNIGNIGGAE